MAQTGLGPCKLVPVKVSSSQLARVCFSIYNLNFRGSSPKHEASAIRVFRLLFSFSIFGENTNAEI